MNITILYRDELGLCVCEVDHMYNISFCDGMCYFTDTEDNDHKIKMEHLLEINFEQSI